MLTDEQIGHSLERYHPCRTGLHVCSVDEEANEPITVANFPFPDDASAADAFCSTGEEFSADEALGEPPDLVVDLMSDGSILENFSMTRQMLGRFDTFLRTLAVRKRLSTAS